MDRDNNSKKRAREAKPKTKPQKKKKRTTTGPAAAAATAYVDVVEEKSNLLPPPPPRELGVFEFPWQEELRPMIDEIDCGGGGSDLREVFFASLVDGCRAAIGFPGDRLSPSPAPIDIPEDGGSRPADLDSEGVDCIWSCALREPLSVYSKASLV